jgi:hypothetical protein
MTPVSENQAKWDDGSEDWVRFTDVQARLEAADRLAEAVEAFQEESYRDGLASEMADALAIYRRSVGKGQEGRSEPSR